jgi:bacteriocin biosynthesis cyclodehydratase domain-containing protein
MSTILEKDLLVLWTGGFGQAVADALAPSGGVRSAPITEEFLADPGSCLSASVGLAAFVGNRPLRPALLQLDEYLWRAGIAWTVCELYDTRLLFGPNVAPGISPCFRCCSARYRGFAFDRQALEQETAFERHMALNPGLEVRGYTPSFVQMAASHVRAIREDAEGRAGLLRELSLPDLAVRQGRAVALHGCRLCRPPAANPAKRFITGLKSAIGIP